MGGRLRALLKPPVSGGPEIIVLRGLRGSPIMPIDSHLGTANEFFQSAATDAQTLSICSGNPCIGCLLPRQLAVSCNI